MSILLDGTGGVTTPGVVNTAGETIATTLSVTGATNLAVSSGNVGIGTASPNTKLHVSAEAAKIRIGLTADSAYLDISRDNATGYSIYNAAQATPFRAHIWQLGGTEAMRIDTSGNLLFNSGYGSAATAYGCRAWVNFNGTGTPAIRASGNVSSITDNGTGDYTVNFTTAMPDVNYTRVVNKGVSGGFFTSAFDNITAPTTSAFRLGVRGEGGGTYTDIEYIHVSVFR